MNEIGFYYQDKPGCKVIKVAEKWVELTPLQLAKALTIRHLYGRSDQAAVKLLGVLLHLDHRFFLHRTLKRHLGPTGLADCLLYIRWMLGVPEVANNRFPILKIGHWWKPKTLLYGPPLDKILDYMTFLEWIKSETYFRQYLYHANDSSAQEKALNRLVASLYRAKVGKVDVHRHNGDPRSPFNDFHIDKFEKLVAKVNIGIRMAIFYYFQYHRAIWARTFDHVYNGEAAMVDATTEAAPSDMDLFMAMKNMSGGALYMEQMGNVYASSGLLDLNDKIKEHKQLKNNSHGS